MTITEKFRPYPKYKDSGVEYLGKVPEHWGVKKIKHNTYVKGRIGWQGLKSEEFIDEGPYLVTGTDFVNGHVNWDSCYHVAKDRYDQDPYIQLREKDLLITKDGTIGKTAIVFDMPDKACLNSGIFLTRPIKPEYISKYMYWLLNSAVFINFIDYMKTGTTINHLYQNVFVEFAYHIPEINEQLQIAQFLDNETSRIDNLIEKKNRQIELLQEKRSALITHVVTKGLNPNVKMKDSGVEWIGEIPEGWEVKRLRYVFKNMDHRRVPLSAEERSYMEKKYPYYGASGVIDTVDNYLFDEPLLLVAEDGANLLSRSSPLAFIAEGKYWVNNHAHILKPKLGSIKFWEGVMQCYDYTPLISGAAQPKLTAEKLSNIFVPLPEKNEQIQIAQFLEKETSKIDTLISKIQFSIDKLTEFRTALISAAVTGKIDVRNWKKEAAS